MKAYSVIPTSTDPKLTFTLPAEILRDLAIRAQENGRSLEIELTMRLVSSLRRDLAMIEADNETAFKAFECVSKKHLKK